MAAHPIEALRFEWRAFAPPYFDARAHVPAARQTEAALAARAIRRAALAIPATATEARGELAEPRPT
jgi:hypothetical protein